MTLDHESRGQGFESLRAEASSAAPPARRDLDLGYRAIVFHAGALCRLNELGWLKKLDAISSVSGGSIAAGLLGAVWSKITWDQSGVATNFDDLFLRPLLDFSQTTTDFPCIAYGVAAPWTTAAEEA